jgi:hypothetical protein
MSTGTSEAEAMSLGSPPLQIGKQKRSDVSPTLANLPSEDAQKKKK